MVSSNLKSLLLTGLFASSSLADILKRQSASTCFAPIASFPNGVTTTQCYPSDGYYNTVDLGSVSATAADASGPITTCQNICAGDPVCVAFVVATQLGANGMASATCFEFKFVPAPRGCVDASSRRLDAKSKVACPTTTSTTVSMRPTTSMTNVVTTSMAPPPTTSGTSTWNTWESSSSSSSTSSSASGWHGWSSSSSSSTTSSHGHGHWDPWMSTATSTSTSTHGHWDPWMAPPAATSSTSGANWGPWQTASTWTVVTKTATVSWAPWESGSGSSTTGAWDTWTVYPSCGGSPTGASWAPWQSGSGSASTSTVPATWSAWSGSGSATASSGKATGTWAAWSGSESATASSATATGTWAAWNGASASGIKPYTGAASSVHGSIMAAMVAAVGVVVMVL